MAVHVDEMTSEVTAEPEAMDEGDADNTEWMTVDKLRGASARALRDQARTAAEGFDD